MSRGLALALAYLCLAAAVFFLRPAQTPGPFLRDFEAYWAAGSTWGAHANAYSRDVWNAEQNVAGVDAARDELLPFIGPPSTLPIWGALARFPYLTAARIWTASLACALALLVLVSLRASAVATPASSLFAAAALALSFGPITSDLALGQAALLGFAGAALLVAVAQRSLIAATLSGVVAFAQPNVALGLASQLGRNRATLSIVAAVIFSYIAGAVAAGWGWPLEYARAVASHGSAERLAAIQLNPAAVAYGFGASPDLARAIGVAIAALAAIAGIALTVRVRDRFAAFAATSALVPFVAGFVHEHDLVVTYPASILCALHARGRARTIAFAGTLLVAIDWLGLAQRPAGIAQSALLALAAAASFTALGERPRVGGVVSAVIMAAAFTGAAWLAVHHPAPIWPDALGAFHAPANASAAEVWNLEQRATGLFAIVPTWALLRSLSLTGCALLAYAVFRTTGERVSRPSD